MNKRTEEILAALVKEYIESASPIGSFTLVKDYNFPFSSATIRTEMAALEELGYLFSPHTSAGRIPTEKGYRYYVDNFIEEPDFTTRESLVLKKKILAFLPRFEKMLNAASKAITDVTGNASLLESEGIVYKSGIVNLLRQPEFKKEKYAIGVAEIFENLDEVLKEIPDNLTEAEIYIGKENPVGKGANCSMVFAKFETPFLNRGTIGIIGPTRMSYEKNLGVVRYVKNIFENELEGVI